MSKAYCIAHKKASKPTTTAAMRKHSQRPGKADKDGNIIYFTEQSHKNQCDVNKIIRKYDRNGIINHVSKFEAQFGDVSGLEFKSAQDKVIQAKAMFNELPSSIRKRFQNNPGSLLGFMENPDNRQEAIDLGLIRQEWTPETDGLGEHILEGQNKNKEPIPEPSNPSD